MRGYQRKVIFLKNTGCDLFDEAYFVLSHDCEKEQVCEDSMIAAASKIINESISLEKEKRKQRILKKTLKIAIPFIFGVALSLIITVLF